jgi:hypothetical protein
MMRVHISESADGKPADRRMPLKMRQFFISYVALQELVET